MVRGIIALFNEARRPLSRRNVSDALLKRGLRPQGKYFETTVAKALKRLVGQGLLTKINDDGAIIYQPNLKGDAH